MSKDPIEEFLDKCPIFLNFLANIPDEEIFKRLDEGFNYKTDLEIIKGNSINEELETDKYILEDIKNE